jgi:hypothetical protein
MARAHISTSTLLAEVAHDDRLEAREVERQDRLAWAAEYVTLCDEMQAEDDAWTARVQAEDDAYRAQHPACPGITSFVEVTAEQIAWAQEVASRFDLDDTAAEDAEDYHDSCYGKGCVTIALMDRQTARTILMCANN